MNWRQKRKNATTSSEIARYLKNENPLIRAGVIDNPNIDIAAIMKLLNDSDFNVRIKTIKKYQEFAAYMSNDHDWRVRYFSIKDNFLASKDVLSKFLQDENYLVRNEAKNILNISKEYIYREDFDNCITIKLVIPGSCNADCCFCYNGKHTNNKNVENLKEQFLNSFLSSLENIIMKIDGKQPISLDITGNEPTFDSDFLIKVLNKLRSFYLKDEINRITLTTNGYNLEPCIPFMKNVINYVNISVHHYDYNERCYIFNTQAVSDFKYEGLVVKLLDIGINTSAVAVIYKPIGDIEEFVDAFSMWANEIGFVSIRFRSDVFCENNNFVQDMERIIENSALNIIKRETTIDSNWCQLSTKTGFMIYFLKGVIDTSKVSPGIEFIINDDGELYADFYKKIPIDDYPFPFGYIFDKKTA